MTSETRQPSEYLKFLFNRYIYIPTYEDIHSCNQNLGLISPQDQENPFMVVMRSRQFGNLTIEIPGITGDVKRMLPLYLRDKGIRNILCYRSSHEGNLNIHHPLLSDYEDLGKLNGINIYSKGFYEDTPTAIKCASFLRGIIDRPLPDTRLKNTDNHSYEFLTDTNDHLFLNSNSLDGYNLYPDYAQMEEVQLLKNNDAINLTFRQKHLDPKLENTYRMHSYWPQRYQFRGFYFGEVPEDKLIL